MTQPLVPVILSGGAGRRLWPLSTEEQPKQFLKLWPGGRSLFQMTLERIGALDTAPPVIIANVRQAGLIGDALAVVGGEDASLLLEPLRRDTAPAIAAAAVHVHDRFGPDTVMAVLPSDHVIDDHASFAGAMDVACAAAGDGFLCTFGIPPTRPASEFGYIELGAQVSGLSNVLHIARFVEKPDADRAAQLVEAGGHLWNSGMFVFRVDAFLAEAEAYMSDGLDAARHAVRGATADPGSSGLVLDAQAFARAPAISIDYAVFEKSGQAAVVPAGFDWSDLGNWASVHDSLGGDIATGGDARVLDSDTVLALSDGIPLRVLGVTGLAVIASADGVLIVGLDRAAEVKRLLDGA
ncbi:MAG: sugar phosphate nucleotidyltransferase [Pseudomonadota bacterium]